MQIGIDSFAAAISDPATGLTLSPVERMHHLLEERLSSSIGSARTSSALANITAQSSSTQLGYDPLRCATRTQFDVLRGPTGAPLIGDAKTVAKKILYVNEVLGGISRVTFQMGVSTLPHEKMLHAIEILGTAVAHVVRNELRTTAVSP